MPSSSRKQASNRANAQKSTGPTTQAGKKASSGNALRHGVLSRNLLLPNESKQEFNELMQCLMAELAPVGTLEQLLVERIVVAVWQQRRLVAAESAALQEQQYTSNLSTTARIRALAAVGPDSDKTINFYQQYPEHAAELKAIVDELSALDEDEVDLAAVEKRCPLIWAELLAKFGVDPAQDADQQRACILKGMTSQAGDAGAWFADYGYKNYQALRVVRAVEVVRDAMSMSMRSDVFSRYHTSLDNEWFKAMRALREAQKHRLEQAALSATKLVE